MYDGSVLWKKTTTILTILLLTTLTLTTLTLTLTLTLTPTTHAQTNQNKTIQTQKNWQQKLLKKGFLQTGPHGLALNTFSYLFGKTKNFINHLTLKKTLNGTKKQNTASIIAHALTIKQAEKTTLKIQKNHIHDARNLVWAKIKKQTLKALKNNKTKKTAKKQATKTIKNYYSTIQYSLNQQLNTEIKTIKHLVQKNKNTKTLYKKQFTLNTKIAYYNWGNKRTITKKTTPKFYKKNTTLLNNSKQKITDIKQIKIPRIPYLHKKIIVDGAIYSNEKRKTGGGSLIKTGIYAKGVNNQKTKIISSKNQTRMPNDDKKR